MLRRPPWFFQYQEGFSLISFLCSGFLDKLRRRGVCLKLVGVRGTHEGVGIA